MALPFFGGGHKAIVTFGGGSPSQAPTVAGGRAAAPGTISSPLSFGGGGVTPGYPPGGTSNLQIYNPRVAPFNVPNDGTAAAAGLDAIIAAIAGADATLYLPPGNWGLEADLVIPANVLLWMAKGARFTAIGAPRTLTINGELLAPRDLLFDSSVADLTVLFGVSNRQQEVFPEWFGAKGDSDGAGGGTNDSPAFAAAVASLPWAATLGAPVGRLILGRARYRLSSPLTPNATDRIVHVIGGGAGRNGGGAVSVLVPDAGVNGINVTPALAYSAASLTEISGVAVIAAGKTAAADGIYATTPIRLRDFYVRGFKGDGLSIRGTFIARGIYAAEGTTCNGFVVEDGSIDTCDGNGFIAHGADANTGSVSNVFCSGSGLANFRDDSLYGVKFDNCWSDKTAAGGVGFTNSVLADSDKERATHCINCYDGDYIGINPNSDLRHPARIDGGTLAYQIKAATSTAHITPPETGPWNPTLSFSGGGSVGYNFSFTGGRWMHYGDEVVLEGTLLIGALAAPVDDIYITGLTGLLNDTGRATNANFIPAPGGTRYHTFPIMGQGHAAGIAGGLSGRIVPTGVLATSFEIHKNVAGGSEPMVGADLVDNTSEFYFRIAYRVI